jgi:hypothetical protein
MQMNHASYRVLGVSVLLIREMEHAMEGALASALTDATLVG